MATRLYGVLWRWHFLAGLVACPILFVVALTGALYTFQPELERWTSADSVEVTPAGERRALDDVIAAVPTTCTPAGIGVPREAVRPVSIYCSEGARREVLVDPYRAVVVGERSGTTTVFGVILELHWELMLGERGRIAIEWATSLTVVLLVTGALLWWPRGRRTGGVWWPRRDVGSRQRLRDLHAIAGAYTLPIVFVIAATGLMWTVYAGQKRWHPLTEDALHEAFDRPPTSTMKQGAPRIPYASALRTARGAYDLGCYIEPATTPEAAIYISCFDEDDPSALRVTWLDAYTGQPLRAIEFSQRSVLGKLDSYRYSLHVGTILGLPTRIAACLGALVLAALCVTGPWMWWKRRPRGKLGVPPPPRRRPYVALALLCALGWVLPTVGITVIAIALVEAARALWRHVTAVAV